MKDPEDVTVRRSNRKAGRNPPECPVNSSASISAIRSAPEATHIIPKHRLVVQKYKSDSIPAASVSRMAKSTGIRIMQLKMQRSVAITTGVRQLVSDKRLDILLL